MAIIFIILIVSLSFNAVFFYMSKSWKIHFTEKWNENTLFKDDNVFIKVERHFGRLFLSVQSKELTFEVYHELDKDTEHELKDEGRGLKK